MPECLCGMHGWVRGCMGVWVWGGGVPVWTDQAINPPWSYISSSYCSSWVAQHLKIDIPLTHFQLSLQLSPVTALRTQLYSLSFPETVWKRWARQALCSKILGPLQKPSLPLHSGARSRQREPRPSVLPLAWQLIICLSHRPCKDPLVSSRPQETSRGCHGLLTLPEVAVCRH